MLALPLVAGSTNTASAGASRSTNVDGAITYLVHPGIGQLLTRARQGDGARIHVHRPFSRTWS